ncbi:Thioesterase/thiol ester dehydrase-isomerase [Balamuthia mandrillaris]
MRMNAVKGGGARARFACLLALPRPFALTARASRPRVTANSPFTSSKAWLSSFSSSSPQPPPSQKEHENDYSGRSTARTQVTTALWEKRVQAQRLQLEKFVEELTGSEGASSGAPAAAGKSAVQEDLEAKINSEAPSFLLDKTPAESAVELYLPFSTDQNLREQYVNFYGNLRFGKILEDLDAAAGNVAHAHADDNNPVTRPLTIVTASVDRIDLLDKLLPDRDMRMKGCVTYVGSSSMEVRVDVESKDPDTGRFYPLILATFTMVATFEGRPAPVNRLNPQTEQEKLLYALGQDNKQWRKQWAKEALHVQPPTLEEQQLIHQFFTDKKWEVVRQAQAQGQNGGGARGMDGAGEEVVEMKDAKLQSVMLCQPQDRNTNDKIFGGYLMQKSFELAWTNAHVYCRSRPWFLALDHVAFHRPVSIGSIVSFNSSIVYTEQRSLGVKVTAEVVNPKDGSKQRTNTMHYTFTCPESSIPHVLPVTYQEAMDWVEGRRRYLRGKETATRLGSNLLRFY